MTDIKQALEQKASAGKNQPVKLTKSMTIVDMVKALEAGDTAGPPRGPDPGTVHTDGPVRHQQYPGAGGLYPHELYCRPDERGPAGAGTQHAPGTGLPDSV